MSNNWHLNLPQNYEDANDDLGRDFPLKEEQEIIAVEKEKRFAKQNYHERLQQIWQHYTESDISYQPTYGEAIRAVDKYGDKQENREAIKLINMDLNKHSDAITKAQTLQTYVNYLKSRPRDGN